MCYNILSNYRLNWICICFSRSHAIVSEECQAIFQYHICDRTIIFLTYFPSGYIPRRASLDLTRITLHSRKRLAKRDSPKRINRRPTHREFSNWNTALFRFNFTAPKHFQKVKELLQDLEFIIIINFPNFIIKN